MHEKIGLRIFQPSTEFYLENPFLHGIHTKSNLDSSLAQKQIQQTFSLSIALAYINDCLTIFRRGENQGLTIHL